MICFNIPAYQKKNISLDLVLIANELDIVVKSLPMSPCFFFEVEREKAAALSALLDELNLTYTEEINYQ